MFEKLDIEKLEAISKKLKETNKPIIDKYLRILKLNRIQFTKHKKGAGRTHAVKPSGTNKGRSRLPRVLIPHKGLVAKGRPNTVGGPRAYHDRQFKRILKINKKEKRIAHVQMLVSILMYKNTYLVNNIDLLNRKLILSELKSKGCNMNKKINKTYRKFQRAATILYEDNGLYNMYKNTCVDTFNLSMPDYLKLELVSNSNHIVLISKKSFEKIYERI